jgi:cation diffusion facilitator CzcD-associated flavoprotein CzcO
MKKANEIVVIGAGPAGLVLANCLKSLGIPRVKLIGVLNQKDRGLGIWPNA